MDKEKNSVMQWTKREIVRYAVVIISFIQLVMLLEKSGKSQKLK